MLIEQEILNSLLERDVKNIPLSQRCSDKKQCSHLNLPFLNESTHDTEINGYKLEIKNQVKYQWVDPIKIVSSNLFSEKEIYNIFFIRSETHNLIRISIISNFSLVKTLLNKCDIFQNDLYQNANTKARIKYIEHLNKSKMQFKQSIEPGKLQIGVTHDFR